jgi:alcohol dehydrogenase class IV
LARELGFRRTLLVADRGLLASGHVQEAAGVLRSSGIDVFSFMVRSGPIR